MSEQTLKLEDIRIDGGTQPRASTVQAVVNSYAEDMKSGIVFPPVVVFFDGTNYWLADGFHRYNATEQIDRDEIACEVIQGTQRDAQWYSFGANKEHDITGERRTPGDRKRAIEKILKDPEWSKKPQTEIAAHVGVDQSFVSRLKSQLMTSHKLPDRSKATVTKSDGTTYDIDTSNIGKGRKAKAEEPQSDQQPAPAVPILDAVHDDFDDTEAGEVVDTETGEVATNKKISERLSQKRPFAKPIRVDPQDAEWTASQLISHFGHGFAMKVAEKIGSMK